MELVYISLIALFCYMSFLYVLSLVVKNNGVADIGYGIAFIVVIGSTLLQSTSVTIFQILLFAVVCVWALRLAVRIYFKNRGKVEDFRYKAWRDAWGSAFMLRSFFQVYMLQGLVVFVVASPVVLSIVFTAVTPNVLVFCFGIALWIVGFIFEVVADYQLDTFLHSPSNKGKILMSGLWKYSRHPNYFGESTMWFGVAVAAAALTWFPLLGFVSPILITFLLLKVSGVPLLEKRWSGNPQWEMYKKKTSVFVPFFSKHTQ